MDIGAILSQLVLAIGSGLIAGYFAYRRAREDADIKLLSMMAEGNSKERLEAYQRLWRKLKLFSYFPPTENVPYAAVKAVNEDLRDWYFSGDGIYLTSEAHELYKDAQEAIYTLWNAHTDDLDALCEGEQGKAFAIARDKLSDLRDKLAADLRSRLPSGSYIAGAGENNRWSSPT